MALRNDSYTLHLLLPTKVDPLVSLMKVEKVPDSTYDMIGGLDQQIKEIKEVSGPCTTGCPNPPILGFSCVCFTPKVLLLWVISSVDGAVPERIRVIVWCLFMTLAPNYDSSAFRHCSAN